MKVVFTGGGTGGHFYPLVAIAEEIFTQARERRMLTPLMYYMGPSKFDARALFESDMVYVYCPTGKMRRGGGIVNIIKNIGTPFFIVLGIIKACISLLIIYPDVVVSKGGYVAYPVLFAARILRIPIIIHESDTIAGRVTIWSAKFAQHIAISYKKIPKGLEGYEDKIAYTGIPIRKNLYHIPTKEKGSEAFSLDHTKPTLLILGGSGGAQALNSFFLEMISLLTDSYQVIHQTGEKNYKRYLKEFKTTYPNSTIFNNTYVPLGTLNTVELRNAVGACNLIISRAGSTSIAEAALWEKPIILIPIPENISRDQVHNAYRYTKVGGGVVIEQSNLKESIMLSEINNIITNPHILAKMKVAAAAFKRPDAARVIAEKILTILIEHEQ